jgi:isopenicillin N synthase-like dioxygenase
VDFAPFLSGEPDGRRRTARAIAEACHEIGFFYLKNHGVPADAIGGLMSQSQAFFQLPPAERAKSAATPDWYRGWMDLSKVGLSSRSREIQSYRIQTEHPWAGERDAKTRYLYAPNRWPDGLPAFQQRASTYFHWMARLAADLRRAFALGLGLAEDRFERYYANPLYQLTLLHYGSVDPTDEAAVNSTPHTDEGPFTILWQDAVGGLEVKRRDGVWIAAPPIDDAFVINVGDMMMWWSNGRYLSNLHKVRNTSGRERFSVPFFANPDGEAIIEALPEFVAQDGQACYPAAHVAQRMMRFAPKALRDS